MIAADFFARLGLFVIPNFLSQDTCAQLRSALTSADWKPASVAEGGQDTYDEEYRRTKQHAIDDASKNEMHVRLLSIRVQLESHFRTQLSGCQAPKFLSYSVGEFFRVHADTSDDMDLQEEIKARKVSAVVFINRQSDKGSETYSGGALVFYGLFPEDRQLKSRGFPLQPEEGLLIAFPSRMMHEVEPVTRGKRYSIVTWYS
jgi:predicted 2-oxoglutarate/Fe(II)-dependent dioxygenase YbiX